MTRQYRMTRGDIWTFVAVLAYALAADTNWRWLRRVERWAWEKA